MRALATKAWNTSSNSIISHDRFKANYAKLGHVAAFEKGFYFTRFWIDLTG